MVKKIFSFSVLLCTFFIACNNKVDEPVSTNVSERSVFFDKSGMDSTVAPGDDFFSFANGGWVTATEIPDDQSRWGSFNVLYEDNLAKMKGLLEIATAANGAEGSVDQKLGDYYASGMDTATREKLGAKPVQPYIKDMKALKDEEALMQYFVKAAVLGKPSIYGLYVGADEKNSAQNIPNFSQTLTTLPSKEYYFKVDSASEASRLALREYATKLFFLAGMDSTTAKANGQSILDFEIQLAKFHRSPVELRDPQKNYNKMALSDAEKQWPNLRLKAFFAETKTNPDSINVSQPEFYAALNTFVKSQPLRLWKTKLIFDHLNNSADFLTSAFSTAKFEFTKTFSGQKVESELWKKMVAKLNAGLGDMLGKIYVEKYFPSDAKSRMDELVKNLGIAFDKRIGDLDWMSDSTKIKAKQKLNSFMKKIGYPEKWKNYDDVTIDRASFYANGQSIEQHNIKEEIAKIGKPVDKTEWGMTAPTVNAYYNPTNNEIVFPAGILQFPFFDASADDAINYGGIGMVIGHEMTHGFDDQGSQYDAVGNMSNWWQEVDNKNFKAKTAMVVKQYNAFTVLDSVHVNGELTLGENLADIGGLAIAYDAFKMTKQGKDTVTIDGFTPDQRFFLGYAQVWRTKARDERLLSQVKTDPHSPAQFRVNGPVQNFTPWYNAFGVKPGNKMYLAPSQRAKVW